MILPDNGDGYEGELDKVIRNQRQVDIDALIKECRIYLFKHNKNINQKWKIMNLSEEIIQLKMKV